MVAAVFSISSLQLVSASRISTTLDVSVFLSPIGREVTIELDVFRWRIVCLLKPLSKVSQHLSTCLGKLLHCFIDIIPGILELCEGTVLEAIDLGENRNKRHYNLLSPRPISEENL